MSEHSCIYLIHSLLETCSEKEQRVGAYILANPGDSVHPSIDELASRIGVSVSTLLRFVKKLGYGGYQEFRIALATETLAPESRVYESPVIAGSNPVDIAFATARRALDITESLLDRNTLEKIARVARDARVIYLFGLGGSNVVAMDAFHKFIRSGLHCQCASDYHLQLMLASQASPEDLALIISNTGANKDTLAIMDVLRKTGCASSAITTYPRSPLARGVDYLLLSGAPGSSVISEAFSARIAHLAIVDALYIAVMELLAESGLERVEKMRSAIAGRRM